MNRRSPWPLLASIGLTLIIAIASFATRGQRVDVTPVRHVRAPGPAYVAIGDSFTAGGPIGSLQPGSGSCLRSQRNYPSLVAAALDYSLHDASCFGATTHDVLTKGKRGAAQISALNAKTSLVTVSVGGNDLGVYTSIFLTCVRTSRPHAPGSPCRALLASKLAAKTTLIGQRVGAVLDAVEKRAPKARVLVVNYLSLMPHDRACTSTPFTDRDVLWFASVEDQLSAAVTAAAERRGIDIVDVHDESRDRHLCSGTKAWVNGARPRPRDGILFHPNGAGERAIAVAVEKELKRKS